MIGQINRGSNFGEDLYNIAKSSDVKTIVEIGTWNGCGSTKCILDGIRDSGEKKVFISLESNKDRYEEAINNNKDSLNYVNIVWGRITEVYDLAWLKNVTLNAEQQRWLWEDIEWYRSCPNVLDQLPKQIDFLILDGGEFTTIPEFIALKNHYKIIALDDTHALKCYEIRKQLLARHDHTLIKDSNIDRNYSIFKKN